MTCPVETPLTVEGYREVDGSPVENGGTVVDTFATRKFIGPPSTRIAFLHRMFGFWTIPAPPMDPEDPLDPPVWTAPQAYPNPFTDPAEYTLLIPWVFRGRPAEGSGVAQITAITDTRIGSDCEWEIEIDYAFKPLDSPYPGLPTPITGTWIDVQKTTDVEATEYPGRRFKYTGANSPNPPDDLLPEDKKPVIALPTETYDVNWHNVVQPPWDDIRAGSGKLNDAPFLGYPEKSVLFLAPEEAYSHRFTGQRTYSMHYQFIVKTVPGFTEPTASEDPCEDAIVGRWNRSWCPRPISGNCTPTKNQHWRIIQDNVSGNEPYETFDFLKLFAWGT